MHLLSPSHSRSPLLLLVAISQVQLLLLLFDEMPHINIEINANYKYLIDDPTPALGRGSEGGKDRGGSGSVYNDARQVFI